MHEAGAAAEPVPRVTPWRVARAFLVRDVAVAMSYRGAFLFRTGSIFLALASFAYLARFVDRTGGALGVDRFGKAGYLGFWLVGLSVGAFFHVTVTGLSRRIREAQVEGTLEATLSTPAPAAYVVLGATAFDLLGGLVRVAVYLVGGALLFGVAYQAVDPLAVVAVAAVSVAAFYALGLLGGAVTLLLRRTDPVTAATAAASALVGGVLYPVDILPAPLRLLGALIPLAPALDALRAVLFTGAHLAAVEGPLVHLLVFLAACGPLGAGLFAYALHRARKDGSLGHY